MVSKSEVYLGQVGIRKANDPEPPLKRREPEYSLPRTGWSAKLNRGIILSQLQRRCHGAILLAPWNQPKLNRAISRESHATALGVTPSCYSGKGSSHPKVRLPISLQNPRNRLHRSISSVSVPDETQHPACCSHGRRQLRNFLTVSVNLRD